MTSDTPRTDEEETVDPWDLLWVPSDFARELERELASLKSQNETIGKLYAAQSDRVADLEREPEQLKAIFRQSCEEMRAENARLQDRLATITDRDLSPDRRSGANYWRAQYFEARREIANANRGIARLQRRLEGAKERIASLQSDAAMLRAENARLHALLITTNLDC